MMHTKDSNYAQLIMSLKEDEELLEIIRRGLNTYPDHDARDRWTDELFPVEVTR